MSVESKTREDVINLIKSSQQTITLKVLSNMHWIENIVDINYDQVGIFNQIKVNFFFALPQINCKCNWDVFQENELNRNRASNSSDSVWVLHKNGFVNARLVKKADESGKCSVRLDTGQNFDISEDDIENVCQSLRMRLYNRII